MIMTWLIACTAFCWTSVWILFLGKAAANLEGDAFVRFLGRALPIFSASSLLLLFCVLPAHGMTFAFVLWMHHAAFLGLFAFLATAQFLVARGWWQIRAGSGIQAVAGTFDCLWILTEIAPAPIAIAVFMTGLRLIWETPADSLDPGLAADSDCIFLAAFFRRAARLFTDCSESPSLLARCCSK